MNAAFLLVTTAWLAGADPAPLAAKPAPAAPAVTATDACCGDCDGCCEGYGHRLLDKLRGLFHRCGCDCCETCPQPAGNPCESCGRAHNFFAFFHRGCGCEEGCCAAPAPAPAECCDTCGCGHRLLDKLRGLFHRCDDCCDCCGASISGNVEPVPAPKEPGHKMPTTTPKKVEAISPVPELETSPKTSLTIEPETKSPFELHRRYESRVGHAPDYSWVTGQLFYVHADGGLWVLRYAPLWKEDPNGGSLVLARDVRMDTYREGDLVTVHGEIVSQRSSVFLGGPLYRAQSIELIDRTQR